MVLVPHGVSKEINVWATVWIFHAHSHIVLAEQSEQLLLELILACHFVCSLGLSAVCEIESTVLNLAAHYDTQGEAVFLHDLAHLCETVLLDLLHMLPFFHHEYSITELGFIVNRQAFTFFQHLATSSQQPWLKPKLQLKAPFWRIASTLSTSRPSPKQKQ
jgi:hypothetical protein